MRIYAYLRASTDDQDANRARGALEDFVGSKKKKIATWFIENESGATLKRPELFRLLDVAQPGDVLLVEQVDRISRLNSADWESLKATITTKGIRVVALDLPTSHQLMKSRGDDFTDRMLAAVNAMMLDMLAAVARKDYEDRRRRQAEGVAAAKKAGKFRGGQPDLKLRDNIRTLLSEGKSYSQVIQLLGCSRGMVAKVSKMVQAESATGRR